MSPARSASRRARPAARGPRSLADAVGTITDALAPATLLADVQRAWPEIVGAAIAAQAEPTSERGGVVTVACGASVWAQELDLMAPQILARLSDAIGAERVRKLRCVAVGHGR